jgi:hypothetical protein
MQDLAELDSVAASDAGVEMQLYHPKTQSDLGIFITLLGRDSKDYRRVQSAQNRKRTERMTKGGVFKPAVVTSEEIEQNTIELLSACTKAWRSVAGEESTDTISIGGQAFTCTTENAAMLYTKYPWIKEQVDAFVSDRANFMKGSSAA